MPTRSRPAPILRAGRARPTSRSRTSLCPPDHPRLHFADYRVRAVAYDIMPVDSPLRRLYEWDPLKDLIEAVLGRGPIYRYADPFGALNLAVMGEGDQLQWHFDQTDFVVSLAIQSAERGGDFEVGAAPPQRRRRALRRRGGRARRRAGRVETLRNDAGHAPHLRGAPLAAPGQPRSGAPLAPCRAPGLRHEAGHHGQRPAAGGPLRAHGALPVPPGPGRSRRDHGVRRVLRRRRRRGGTRQHGAGCRRRTGRDSLGDRLATPRAGHVAFVAAVRPGVAVRPFTLFVNKAAIEGERHARLTWGAAQAGVAAGVMTPSPRAPCPRPRWRRCSWSRRCG